METSKVISTDKSTVVIQVNPQVAQNAVIDTDGHQVRGAYRNTALTEFFKAQPKALGTVQIMIGVVCFLFGIIRTNILDHIPAIEISGINFWGSLIYISAGSLSVAARNKLHPCVVKASLGMNVISAITAGIAIVLMSFEISGSVYYGCYYDYNNYSREYNSHYSNTREMCLKFKGYDLGISGILLVFSVLQFIISICISGFACKATSSTDFTVVNVALN
ncbi:membrane-spanning 4-domains subfamily A member 4A-like [Pseudorasbora parva]|uniref:membrane-spanning 4-domains subfamily A member 4A-like n=1 Tax=Pseudorasbora parva TaxID=51549 RepID=UPI00351F701A